MNDLLSLSQHIAQLQRSHPVVLQGVRGALNIILAGLFGEVTRMASDAVCVSKMHPAVGVAIMLFRMVTVFVRERHPAIDIAMELRLCGHRAFVRQFTLRRSITMALETIYVPGLTGPVRQAAAGSRGRGQRVASRASGRGPRCQPLSAQLARGPNQNN